MAYSTIPAAVDQMLVVIAARLVTAGMTDVLVADGLPADLPAEHERVFVDDAVNVRREWAALGQLRIDETYAIKVAVETYMPGSDRAACRHRLFAIIAEVEQAVVRDITLAGVLNWGAKPNAMAPQIFPTDDGWLGSAMLQFDCSGRIQAS